LVLHIEFNKNYTRSWEINQPLDRGIDLKVVIPESIARVIFSKPIAREANCDD